MYKKLKTTLIKGKPITFKHFKNDRQFSQSIRVYCKKKIAILHFSTNSDKQGYLKVYYGYVDSNFRGLGIYTTMIILAGDEAYIQDKTGVKSCGFQRNMVASSVWNKISTHLEPYTSNAQIKGKISLQDSDCFYKAKK